VESILSVSISIRAKVHLLQRRPVGLSLLDENDTRAPNIPAMADDARKALGGRLDTFLLGNEPDLYAVHRKRPQYKNYTAELYFNEFKVASAGLGKITDPPLIGTADMSHVLSN
jgi:hypothetical protein